MRLLHNINAWLRHDVTATEDTSKFEKVKTGHDRFLTYHSHFITRDPSIPHRPTKFYSWKSVRRQRRKEMKKQGL